VKHEEGVSHDESRHSIRDGSTDGYRVLGLATVQLPGRDRATAADESAMTLLGPLAFHDPVKPDAAQAITGLSGLSVSVRLVTGANRLVSRTVSMENVHVHGEPPPAAVHRNRRPVRSRRPAHSLSPVRRRREPDRSP
jgi:magnesium-transporting ATPase (P-type)